MTLSVISDRHTWHNELPLNADRRSPRINFQYTTRTRWCEYINMDLKDTDLQSFKWNNREKSIFFWSRQYVVGVVAIPQSKDSSSRSAWHSSRLSRSPSRWLQQLSGCRSRLRISWSSVNWCSRSFPPQSTLPQPTQPHLPADRTYRYKLKSDQMLISRMHHVSYEFAAKMWACCMQDYASFFHCEPTETLAAKSVNLLVHIFVFHTRMSVRPYSLKDIRVSNVKI